MVSTFFFVFFCFALCCKMIPLLRIFCEHEKKKVGLEKVFVTIQLNPGEDSVSTLCYLIVLVLSF